MTGSTAQTSRMCARASALARVGDVLDKPLEVNQDPGVRGVNAVFGLF